MPFDALPNPDQYTVDTNSDLRLLRLARDLLRKGRWCQGGLEGPDNAHCAIGWVVEAYKATDPQLPDPVSVVPRRVTEAVYHGFGISPRALAEFNDHPRTKKRHVVDAFEKAVWQLENA